MKDGTGRDFGEEPYTADEARVARFLFEIGVGGGEDRIGFILLSHRTLADERNAAKDALRQIAALDDGEATALAKAYLAGELG